MGGLYKHLTPNGVKDGALFPYQLPAKGALHEAVEEMLLLRLALLGAQGFTAAQRRRRGMLIDSIEQDDPNPVRGGM